MTAGRDTQDDIFIHLPWSPNDSAIILNNVTMPGFLMAFLWGSLLIGLLFMFDEPFGALDEISRERLQDELLRIFDHEGFAGLFITHSVPEAVFLSTRVLCMSARPGRIIADFSIPWEYPRRHDIRYSPEFAEMCGKVSESLREAHA